MEQGTGSIPTFTVENITPELAAHYLTFNTANRPAKKAKIAQYARDMVDGNWLMTAEPIKFSPDKILRDGQNRLYAVIEAQVAVTMIVARNVPAEAMVVMDAGSPRTKGDALGLVGYAAGKDLAATANVHYAWTGGNLPTVMSFIPTRERLSNVGVVEYVRARPELVEATHWGRLLYPALRLPAGAIAVAFDAVRKIDPDQAAEFFDRIRDMRAGGSGDPVAALLKRTRADRDTQRKVLPATALYYLFRTWNAFRVGESLLKFQVGSVERGWTVMPEPK